MVVLTILENILKAYQRVTKKDEKMNAVRRALQEEGLGDIKVYWNNKKAEAWGEATISLEDKELRSALEWLVGERCELLAVKVVATTRRRKSADTGTKRWKLLGLPYKYFTRELGGVYVDTIEIGEKEFNGIKVYMYIDIYSEEAED